MVTEQYTLIGRTLGHSFSARFFTEKFSREHIDAAYTLSPIPEIGKLPELLSTFQNLRGFNVTIPYKEEVMRYLDAISPEARAIGAVNVVKVSPSPAPSTLTGLPLRLTGYNTDCIGFSESLRPMLRPDVTKALVAGSGGASKAVVYALRQLGITPTVVSRHPKEGELSYADLDAVVMADHLLIVNATPLGTFPDTHACIPIPYELITPNHICFDLVYNPELTLFMSRCSERGATVKNGLEMLHGQALAAWNIWNS